MTTALLHPEFGRWEIQFIVDDDSVFRLNLEEAHGFADRAA